MGLLIEELPADLVLPGQLGDRFSPGEHLDGQVLPLLRQQSLGGTRNTDIDRSGRDCAGDRREIALRDREVRSSLTIHVCFLRETVFVGTNNPNMEETGSIENPIPSGKCYLELNRAQFPQGRPTPSPYKTTTPSTSHQNPSSALGATHVSRVPESGWPLSAPLLELCVS